jgi:aminoglycoside phosphotransferase (APT) family kinase protein
MGHKPPPAQGVRLDWQAVPAPIRAAAENALDSTIVSATTQASGFSPGVAARLRLADDRGAFVKAISSHPNPDSPEFHRREAQITAALPVTAPVPRLLWSYDDGDWVVLVLEEVVGEHPVNPWLPDELDRVIDGLAALNTALTPTPVDPALTGTASEKINGHVCGWRKLRADFIDRLDAWSARHLDALAEIEDTVAAAVAGDTLLHFDTRADNILLTPDKVWFVDWPHACVGAAWVDVVFFAPSATMQGAPSPETIIARHPACQSADSADITAAIVAIAGFFTRQSLLPPPPGLPTLRSFQAAQGEVAREWIAQRMGWE